MSGEETVKVSESKDIGFSLSESKKDNLIIGKQDLNITEGSSLTVYIQYHKSEIEQNKKIYETAKGIVWAGFCVIVVGIILAIFDKTTPALITTISGIISQFISGAVMAFLTHSSKTKLEYYKQLSFDEECNKYIKTIEQLSDDKKAALLTKLIENYCNRRG